VKVLQLALSFVGGHAWQQAAGAACGMRHAANGVRGVSAVCGASCVR
jgi:hypothetical protein